jgi:hypothetical protein
VPNRARLSTPYLSNGLISLARDGRLLNLSWKLDRSGT